MEDKTITSKPLANLYLLIILSLTYTAAHYWPVLRYAMLFFIVGFGLPLLLSRKFFATKMFWWWLAYSIVVALNVVVGDKYFKNGMSLLYEAAYLFIPSSMIYYAFSKNDIVFQKRSLVLFFVILVLMTIATIYISGIHPGVVRNLNRYSDQENEGFYDSLYRLGLVKFSTTHSLFCLVPAVIMGLKNHSPKRFVKLLLWMALAALLLLAYYSGSFACFILSFGGLIISLVVKDGSILTNTGRLLFFFLLLSLVLTPTVRISVLNGLESRLDSESDFYVKVVELQEMEQADNALEVEGDFSTRLDLYSKSLTAGASDLLVGTQGESLGNHSAFLDRFGSLGLLGIIPYLLFILTTVSYSWSIISSKIKVYYLIGLMSSLLMLLSKSINSWDFWFISLFVLPVAIKVLTPEEESPIVDSVNKEII